MGMGFPPGAACSKPTRAEGRDRDCPPCPRERARLAQPCSSESEAGRLGGAGSGAVPRWPESRLVQAAGGHRRVHWGGHWLRESRLKSVIGCVGLSWGGDWLLGAGKMSPGARAANGTPAVASDPYAPDLRSGLSAGPPGGVPQGVRRSLWNCPRLACNYCPFLPPEGRLSRHLLASLTHKRGRSAPAQPSAASL